MRSDSSGDSNAGGATRVAVLHVHNRLTYATRTSEPLAVYRNDTDNKQPQAPAPGIPIGRDACHLDPLVSITHGTLECTPQHGVWVYIDHSEHGTTLNHKRLVHRDAAIVRDGDVLSLGNTEITLAFQIQPQGDNDNDNNNQASTVDTTHSPSPPPPPPAPILPSQLARAMLPNIQTATRLQQPPPEYINSPIPGTNWRKKRHSISHVARRPVTLGEPASLISASQTFARSKPLVPSAPSTPPQRQDPPAARHVTHHVAHSPQSAYYHTKFKQEEPESIPEDDAVSPQQREMDESESNQPPPPPLEYSSSPVTSTVGLSFLNRLQHASASSPSISSGHSSRPSPPTTPAPAVPFVHKNKAHHFEPTKAPARASNRPIDLRIQIAKRNAGLASASASAASARPFSAGTTTTPTAAAAPASATATTRPALLSRGITIPTTTPTTINTYAEPSSAKRRLDFTPPASPVAHQDILRQNQSLLNILKTKYKEEQTLQRQQEEWMRSQFPSPSGGVAVPSMSPIRHEKDSGRDEPDGNANDLGIGLPAQAPALLRTVSLGQTQPAIAAAHYHQPSPRLTQAVLASRARKATLSPRGDVSPVNPSTHLHHLRPRSSGGSSVASSVSTEPSNHRRVVVSLSISSLRASGELSDFLGYDDDDGDDGLLSFSSFYGDGALDTAVRTAPAMAVSSSRTAPSLMNMQRGRAPSLDDDMAGVLNSPSHAAASIGRLHAFAMPEARYVTTKEPKSVAKPRPQSADVRRGEPQATGRTRRQQHPFGIDLDRSLTHA